VPTAWTVLLGAAGALSGLLAGASVDQSVKQLPARNRMGMRAFSSYTQAADLGNGRFLYPLLGVGGAVLTCAAAIWALILSLPTGRLLPVIAAGVLSVAHSVTTARAAPIMWSQMKAKDDEASLALIFRAFARWQALRMVLQVATFGVIVYALALNGDR